MTERICRDCNRPLKQIHPEARFDLQWDHTSLDDARDCTAKNRPSGAPWPLPKED
jgi:hypothetical protein